MLASHCILQSSLASCEVDIDVVLLHRNAQHHHASMVNKSESANDNLWGIEPCNKFQMG